MLVRPFIQPINAFDVSQNNGVAIVSVLGGDIIQKINYEIYSGSSLVYNSSVAVSDNGGDTIRDFTISLSSSMGLANNNAYTLRAYTERTVDGTTEYSGYSSVQYFSCYVTPTITIKDESDNTISSGYVFTSQSGTLTAVFNAVSASSPAMLNDIEINIFGINGTTRDLVYSSGETYTPFVVEFDNLTPTTVTNPLYTSYTLEWTAHTVQNMELSGSFSAMTCDYTITQSTGLISAENDGANGRIKVTFFPNGTFGNLITTPFETLDIYSIATDENNVYIGGANGKFAIYNKSNGTFGNLITTPFGSSNIWSLAIDENNVYAGGDGGMFAIYNKANGSFGNLITTPFDDFAVSPITVDENNVYAGGAYGMFAIYNKANGTFGNLITTPFGSSSITTIVSDENNVYAGGFSGFFAIYNKNNGTFGDLITTPFVSGLSAAVSDENNVYVGCSDGKFAIYNKSNGTFGDLITTPFGTSGITTIVSDENNVYAGGASGTFAIYNKSNGSFGDLITTPFGATSILSIAVDENNVYAGGSSGTFAIYQLKKNVLIRRREINENNFYTLLSVSHLAIGNTYFLYDYFAKTNAIYEYQITIGNQVETVEVLSQFCGAYIADGEQAFEIDAEWERGSFSQVQQSAIYEPYGAKYPVIAYNAVTNYRKGTDSCIVFNQPYAYNRSNDYIDRINQTKKQKAVNEFLTNRKPKVIKDFNGDIALVSIVDVVGNSFVKELGNTLATTQFNWVEVGDFDDDTFRKLGITNSFKLYEN